MLISRFQILRICFGIGFMVTTLTGLHGKASVWETTEPWTVHTDEAYREWIRKEWHTDVFKKGPYAKLGFPDCADTVISAPLIFSSIHGLPFAFTNPATGNSVISNEIDRFDDLPRGLPRIRAFLKWVWDLVSTQTLPFDSYPISINRKEVAPGAFMLAYEKTHSYTVKEVDGAGVPLLYYSTTHNRGPLLTRSWPSTWFLFPSGLKQPNGIRRFRHPKDLLKPVWQVPGYSEQQYELDLAHWTETIQNRLALHPETVVDSLNRRLRDICTALTFRIDLVKEAVHENQRLGDKCMSKDQEEDLSTPSRDQQTRIDFQELESAYRNAIRNHKTLPDHLRERLESIFGDSNRAFGNEYCPIQYAPGRTLFWREFRSRLEAGLISSDPQDSLLARWGFQKGPGEKARRCHQKKEMDSEGVEQDFFHEN